VRVLLTLGNGLPFGLVLVIDQCEELFTLTRTPEDLKHREMAPHVYETADEARRHLHEVERTASSG